MRLTRGGSSRFLNCAVAALFVGVFCVTVTAVSGGPQRRDRDSSGRDHSTTVTFSADIAPLLLERCASCHRPGASAPFSVLSYDDVRPWARAIKQATETRAMPPWKPAPGGGGPFVGERRLTQPQIGLIAAWVDSGALEGDAQDLSPLPDWPDGWRLGEPDLVIEMLEPYELSPEGDAADLIRKFAIPIPTRNVRYVAGLEFQPGNAKVVHHANLRLDSTATSRELDAQDSEPGYDGVTPFSARYPPGHFLGWTPGQVRPLAPEGMAWRLDPGTDMLLELHLVPGGQPESVRSRVGFFFTEDVPTEVPFTIRLGKQDLDIAPGVPDYRSQDRYVLPVDVEVYGVQPHAHYLAKNVTAHATLPDGSYRPLIRIDDWDFDWQDSYRYASPFVLPKGTEVAMEFTYDNSIANRRNPHTPPKRVTWGQKSSNEMGDVWLQVLPLRPSDRTVLENDRRPLQVAEDIVGFEMVLAEDPDQVMVHDEVALLYLQFGEVAKAAAHFVESARLQPDSPSAQYNVGTTLLQLGDVEGAASRFEEALRLDADYVQAHNNLGAVRRAQGRLNEAVHHFRQALRLRPDDEESLYNLAASLTLLGELDEATILYRRLVRAQPETPDALAPLVWILATDPAREVGEAEEAVELGTRAARLTNRQEPGALDALAAAYAAAGRFDEAVATAREAVALLPADQAEVRAAMAYRLQLYSQGLPFQRPR